MSTTSRSSSAPGWRQASRASGTRSSQLLAQSLENHVEATAHPRSSAEAQQQAVERSGALDLGGEADGCAADVLAEIPRNAREGAAGQLGGAVNDVARRPGLHPRAGTGAPPPAGPGSAP